MDFIRRIHTQRMISGERLPSLPRAPSHLPKTFIGEGRGESVGKSLCKAKGRFFSRMGEKRPFDIGWGTIFFTEK